jgi:glutathione S-transferase
VTAVSPGFLSAGPLPVLYSFRRCPYAMRARLALAVSGQPCELREIMLKNKAPEMLAASPKATVPVLVMPDGVVIDQSLDIMLWALRQHDPEHWLTPQQGTLQAMQALIAGNDSLFKHHLDRYKYPNRYAQEQGGHSADEFSEIHRASGALWLMGLDAMLTQHAWLFGQSASWADMAVLPFVRQFAHTDAAWFEAQAWPRLRGWLTRWEASSFFQSVMEKYPPWSSAQAGVVFPPA